MVGFPLPEMRINQYIAVLDTCVLVPMPVVDTLFTTCRGTSFLHSAMVRAHSFRGRTHSPRQMGIPGGQREAQDPGDEGFIPRSHGRWLPGTYRRHEERQRRSTCSGAAVRCGAHAIVSNNKKHFPAELLQPYDMECITADEFLEHQYHLNPDLFISKLVDQAADIGWTLHQLISRHVPSLARLITPPAE
jgi:hypothetical protein